MRAEWGWIGEAQLEREWHDSHYSREADKIARIQAEQMKNAEQDSLK